MTDVAADFTAASAALVAENQRLHDVLLPPPQVIDVPDAGLTYTTESVAYENVLFRSLSTQRDCLASQPVPRGALSFYAATNAPEQRVILRNVRIEDLANVGVYNQSSYLLEGVTALGAGWCVTDDPVRPNGLHGMNFYSQNNTEQMDEAHGCIFGASYSGMSWKFFTEGGSELKHLRVHNTVFLSGQTMAGGKKPVEDVQFDACAWLDCLFAAGWTQPTNVEIAITNSLIRRPEFTFQWQRISFTDNTVYMQPPDNQLLGLVLNQDRSQWTIDRNLYYVDEYYARATPPLRVPLANCRVFAQLKFTDWQAQTGFDAHSELHNIVDMPLQVRVLPVDVGRHAANLAVFNPRGDTSAMLDLGALEHGVYELRSIYDDTDIERVEWNGTPIGIELVRRFVPRIGQNSNTPLWMANPMPRTLAFELWRL